MKSIDSLSITFMYPSRRIGGAQLLFIRLAVELSKSDTIVVNVVDYPDGFLASQLSNYNKVTILPYSNGCVKIYEETVLITPLSNFADLKYLIKGDFTKIRILLWSIHPTNIDYVFASNGRKWFKNVLPVKNFLKSLSDLGNIVYMDEANFLAAKKVIGLKNHPEFLQVPLEIKNYKSEVKEYYDKVNIAWLGRISYDKIFSIIKVVDEIKALKNNSQIVLHIIGTGEKLDQLEIYLKKSGIKYLLVGTLVDDDLSFYMNKYIQIGVAMGTSCMEFATRKIPVFIIDYCVERFPNNIKYNWLFETQNYTLGSDIDAVTHRNHTFNELLNQYETDESLGQKCYNYVIENHNIDHVALKLIDYCRGLKPIDNYSFAKIQKILNPAIYRIFYVLYRRMRRF
jgi:hypothetical protein